MYESLYHSLTRSIASGDFNDVMKRMFHFSHVMVTLIHRIRVKFMFACFGYNVHALKIVQV